MFSFVARAFNNLLTTIGVRVVRQRRLPPVPHKRIAKEFSANREEAILHRLIERVRALDTFYVDIGASDGLAMSNTARLALNGWRGVCFEYDPKRFAVLADAYAELDGVRACRSKVTPNNVSMF